MESWRQDSWTILNCQSGLGLMGGDVLTFEDQAVVVHRYGSQDFSWSTQCDYGVNGYLAQVTYQTQVYGIAFDSQGRLACSPIAPAFFLAGSLGEQNGAESAAPGRFSQKMANAAGGIALGTAAAGLAGLPLWGGLLVASATTLGYAGAQYLQLVLEGDSTNTEGQGSSWTAQGGSQGGSGLQAGGAQPQVA